MPFVVLHRFTSLDEDLNDMLGAMQLLTALAESPPSTEHRERDLTRGIYIVEHVLLNILTEDSGGNRSSPSHIRVAVALAFSLYLYLGLREMPRTAIILRARVKRLRSSLEAARIVTRLETLDASLLFWIATIGVIAARDEEDTLFLEDLRWKSSLRQDLRDESDRERTLNAVVWTQRIGDLDGVKLAGLGMELCDC